MYRTIGLDLAKLKALEKAMTLRNELDGCYSDKANYTGEVATNYVTLELDGTVIHRIIAPRLNRSGEIKIELDTRSGFIEVSYPGKDWTMLDNPGKMYRTVVKAPKASSNTLIETKYIDGILELRYPSSTKGSSKVTLNTKKYEMPF